ncbi:hypothetical protein [Streptomyces lavendulae]|uniref:hypothetical protein n=1 Tax=Streptomyces lavendulae TaxID=1914 RepID=UPI0024A42A6F|nr:hypothetical protein [Streptomyces lavendulae]GLW04288.1 hypothetical protein Slala05_79180 [Streptomyces lavendulae subsp. lavendulae]
MSEPSSNSEGESPAPKKKSAKKIAGLRPRSGSALLSNPALSGAASVVARSVLGQGPTPTASPEVTSGPSAVVPAPSPSTDKPAAAEVAPAIEVLNTSSPLQSTPPQEAQVSSLPEPAPHAEIRTDEPEVAATVVGGEDDPRVNAIEVPVPDPAPIGEKPPSAPLARPNKSTNGTVQRKVPRSTGRDSKPDPVDATELNEAHEALLNSWRDSRLDLKLRKKRWQTQPFRFAADLVESLSRRVAEDCKSSGKTLTAAQYVDAAMARHLPQSIEEQLDLAEDFLISRDSDVGTGQQGSHRVSPEVYAIASELPNALRQEGHARTAVHVYSGALDRFLSELEEAGPLGKANAPRK